MNFTLSGLIPATHTPFHDDGSLAVNVVERQAEFLHGQGIRTVFVGGSTGESHSLTVAERLALAQRWSEVVRGSGLKLVVHVGANCLADARALAAQAQSVGADAIAALSPSYFKPRGVEALVACCVEIASAAPATPFYFYDIPSMTGVALSMPEFLAQASGKLSTLVGLKFTNPDLMAFQRCRQAEDERFDILFGVDEQLLAALALGATGAVGSSYNFAAPVYHRLLAAFAVGDLATARAEQFRSVQLIEVLARQGYMGAAKAVMGWLGVPVGPARLPNVNPSREEAARLARTWNGSGSSRGRG